MPSPVHVVNALQALVTCAPEYEEAEQFYDGTIPEVIASHRLRELFGDTGRYFRINYARTPVDVVLERTMVQGITCSDSTAQKILDAAWDTNELGQEAKDLHRKTYEFGDAYLIGWPNEEVDGNVDLYAHDPRSVRVFYDPAQPRKKTHAIQTWIEPGDIDNGLPAGLWYRVNMYYPDRTEMWVSSQRADDGMGQITMEIADSELVPYVTEQAPDGEVVNEQGIIPVFHFRTGRPYGRPEHADAYGPQNMINKLLVTMMGSVDYAGFPQRYVATDSSLDPTPQQDAFTDPPHYPYDPQDPEYQGLSESSTMEAGPGSTWLLSGSKINVGQFATADTNNFLNPIHSLVKQMATVTDTPLNRFDRSGQMPSGESFRMDEIPLNKKTSDRLATLGVTWHEVFDYVLAVNGMLNGSDAQIAWAPPQVFTDQESWATAILQLGAGVPLDQIYRERGYSEDIISHWIANGAEARAMAAQKNGTPGARLPSTTPPIH